MAEEWLSASDCECKMSIPIHFQALDQEFCPWKEMLISLKGVAFYSRMIVLYFLYLCVISNKIPAFSSISYCNTLHSPLCESNDGIMHTYSVCLPTHTFMGKNFMWSRRQVSFLNKSYIYCASVWMCVCQYLPKSWSEQPSQNNVVKLKH